MPNKEHALMSFKENVKKKIEIDRLVQKIRPTIRETPGQRKVNKEAMRELLRMTDMEHVKARDLELYVRSPDGKIKEILVLDNELPIYHTTVEDVAMRKTPFWKEMFSIRNVKKILNDQDVITSKGKDSLERIHANAVSRLDLSYTREDLTALVADARSGLERRSQDRVMETLDLFFEILDFELVFLGVLEEDIRVFAKPKAGDESVQFYEDPLLLDERSVRVLLLKGRFSPQSDLDLARIMQCARGEKPADTEGIAVFEYLAELALRK